MQTDFITHLAGVKPVHICVPRPRGVAGCVLHFTKLSGTGKRFSNQTETSCLQPLNTGFEAGKSPTPIRQQTGCPPTNRLSYRGSSKKTWTQQPFPIWVSIQPTWLHCRKHIHKCVCVCLCIHGLHVYRKVTTNRLGSAILPWTRA